MPHNAKVRDQLDMKLHNRSIVWELIFTSRPVSRAQLAKITDMSPTSITRIVGELQGFGLLLETPATHVAVGRKATMLDVDKDAFYSVGMDIDADALMTCLVDLDNKPRSFLQRRLKERNPSPDQVMETAYGMFRDMLATTGIADAKVKAIGVSVGGTVDRTQGMVTVSPQLHWKNVALKEVVESRFSLPAVFENDVKAAIYEEYTRYPDCRADTVAYLTIGSGIGAALMSGGRLLRGVGNAAGEIGHITVQPDGDLCDCGRRGCLYTCLSEKALTKKIRALSKPSWGLERWIASYREGESWAVELAHKVAEYMAIALNHILCSYDPGIIIVGGKLVYALPDLLDLTLSKNAFFYDALRSNTRITHSVSKSQDAVIGVAIMAKTAYLDKLLLEKE